MSANNRKQMAGKTYNNWKVVSESYTRRKIVYYNCLCLLCKTEHTVDGRNIRSGASKQCRSCGFKEGAKKNRGQKRPAEVGKKISSSKKGKKLSNKHIEKLKGFRAEQCDPVLYALDPTPDPKNRGLWVSSQANNIKQKAKARGKNWSLSKHETAALIVQNCSYCGSEPNPYNGIDRINSELGYDLQNTTTCCFTCNSAKGNKTVDEFQDWIEKAYKHNFKEEI